MILFTFTLQHLQLFIIQLMNTNQYKDLIAQREFSGSEVRSLIAPALMTFTTSMWFATSEKHSYSTVKLPLCL